MSFSSSSICSLPLLIWILAASVVPFNLGATTVAPPNIAELVDESDYIVRAVVVTITPKEKAKPGKRTLIFSSVELDIKEVIVGTPPDPCVLEVLGGSMGSQEMYISGAPKFTIGQEAIFFVQGNRTQIFPLARMMHGLYPILKEAVTGREYVTRSNGEAMTDVQQISEPMYDEKTTAAAQSAAAQSALSPESFATQIRATAKTLRRNEK